MSMRCVIADDEAPARDELRFLLSGHSEIEIVGEADSAARTVRLCRNVNPDLVFLDIQMPGDDGFEVIRSLSIENNPPLFVFVTAYDNYAIRAFDANAIDYILKPVSKARLAHSLKRASRFLQSNPNLYSERLESLLCHVADERAEQRHFRISVEKCGRIRLLDPKDIIYCSYEDHRILAHTHDDVMPVYGISSMDKMEEHLAGTPFFRAHRSTLVNLDAISEFSPWFNGKYSLVMTDMFASKLTISRSRVRDFKKRLGL